MKQNEILYGILGAIIPYIAVPILGFSKNITFDSTITVSPNDIIGAPKTNNNYTTTSYAQERYCLGCGQKISNGAQFCENCGRKVE